jgi:hypothetical protein
LIELNHTGTGFSTDLSALMDGSGNALVTWEHLVTAAGGASSNYFSRNGGGWATFPPDALAASYGDVNAGGFGDMAGTQLTATTNGNFVMAWAFANNSFGPGDMQIFTSQFTSATRTWGPQRQVVVPNSQHHAISLQRMGSDANGNATLLWTEDDGTRAALMAMRLDATGSTCDSAEAIDSAVGGGAARADLGVDQQGRAIAIWQQFEGGHPDDGSRSNIAISRFDGAWTSAVFAETLPGNAISPRASASGGQALLGWIQSESGTNRVKALLEPLGAAASR